MPWRILAPPSLRGGPPKMRLANDPLAGACDRHQD